MASSYRNIATSITASCMFLMMVKLRFAIILPNDTMVSSISGTLCVYQENLEKMVRRRKLVGYKSQFTLQHFQ